MHATGRSAAFWLESYGGPHVAVLSAASRDFLANPPADFSEHGFLRDAGRGSPDAGRAARASGRRRVASGRARGAGAAGARESGRSGGGRCSSPAAPTSTSLGCMRPISASSAARAERLRTDARLESATLRGRALDGSAERRFERFAPPFSSMPPAPGPTRLRKPAACGRSASRRSGGRWSSFASADQGFAICRWSMTRPGPSISRARATGASG